jgi:hypothetical protein
LRTGAIAARTSSLQENGNLVLRYLAEDLAKELDSVIDGSQWAFRRDAGVVDARRCRTSSAISGHRAGKSHCLDSGPQIATLVSFVMGQSRQ